MGYEPDEVMDQRGDTHQIHLAHLPRVSLHSIDRSPFHLPTTPPSSGSYLPRDHPPVHPTLPSAAAPMAEAGVERVAADHLERDTASLHKLAEADDPAPQEVDRVDHVDWHVDPAAAAAAAIPVERNTHPTPLDVPPRNPFRLPVPPHQDEWVVAEAHLAGDQAHRSALVKEMTGKHRPADRIGQVHLAGAAIHRLAILVQDDYP